MQCPLCRTSWGENAIEILQENSKRFRDSKKEAAQKDKKANLIAQSLAASQKEQTTVGEIVAAQN